MSVLDIFRGGSTVTETASRVEDLTEQLDTEREFSSILQESLADLELMLEDQGWDRLTGSIDGEFTRQGLLRAAKVCRVSAIANPLIKRGLNVRQAYVFGQGVEIKARNDNVNDIVQKFLHDDSNTSSLSGSQAQEELERALGTDGNVFLACFTTPKTGRVEVRSFPFSEINDVIHNPEDRDEPWYYERIWQETSINASGRTVTQERRVFYPDIKYRPAPAKRLKRINGIEVNWNAPIYHISVNRLDGWKFGLADAFAAVSWARAYKEFLEDWADLVKALSRFAWRGKGRNAKAAQSMRAKLAKTSDIDPNTGQSRVGATAIMDDGAELEAIPKTGAVIDSDSGKPLAAMVASALELSLVVLLTDPGSTGARAVAETLDTPMFQMVEKRRRLWQEAYSAIVNYVLSAAARAGRLPGSDSFDTDTRRFRTELTIAKLTDDEARLLDFDWPELGGEAIKDRVEAIWRAHDTGKMPPAVVARLLLVALGVENAEQEIDKMLDADGNFIDPEISATMDAVNRFNRGQDPDQDVLDGGDDDE